MLYFRYCRWCGKPFQPLIDSQNYCSNECAKKGRENLWREQDIESSKHLFAKREMSKIKTGVLDKRLKQAKAEGKTYAELQKEITLEKVRKGEL